ncbi:NAD(+) synthase [Flavihumibacter sp. R14]|nr:NAD(+) synthase [Flavihumibacter soli]
MESKTKLHSLERLRIEDVESLCDKLTDKLRNDVIYQLNRRGAVVGISGGIDSSVTLALAVRAFGAKNVVAIMLPERDSSPDSLRLGNELAKTFGVKALVEDLTEALQGFGCYKRRDEAISRVFPSFNPATDKAKIVINQNIGKAIPSVFSVMIISADGKKHSKLLPVSEYLQIVASTNFKQRSRMSMLYYHAERLHYAVIGTPNKAEVDQGFFVKYGDGGADVMPIGGLYKTQVYQLAEFLGIPDEIIQRTPTTDTYTAEQTQEEFFYQLPFETMDLIWHGWENKCPPEELAHELDKSTDEIRNIYNSFERKRKTTDYLRMPPIFYDHNM